jgi:ATP-dependent DNA ligase
MGIGLHCREMKEAVWIKPQAVGETEFLEWTDGNHLRHTKSIGLREDNEPSEVVRETSWKAIITRGALYLFPSKMAEGGPS